MEGFQRSWRVQGLFIVSMGLTGKRGAGQDCMKGACPAQRCDEGHEGRGQYPRPVGHLVLILSCLPVHRGPT